MNLKSIKIDDIARIIQYNEDKSKKKLSELKSIKIHPETYRTLKKIQSANNLKSVYGTIDILIITAAMAQMSDSTDEYQSIKKRIVA